MVSTSKVLNGKAIHHAGHVAYGCGAATRCRGHDLGPLVNGTFLFHYHLFYCTNLFALLRGEITEPVRVLYDCQVSRLMNLLCIWPYAKTLDMDQYSDSEH